MLPMSKQKHHVFKSLYNNKKKSYWKKTIMEGNNVYWICQDFELWQTMVEKWWAKHIVA